MAAASEETADIAQALPPEKAQSLLEFARFLAETADRELWERRFGDPRCVQKLDELAEEVLAEFRAGKTEPLDPDQM